MAKTETLKRVPEDRVAQIVAGWKAVGYTVQKTDNGDGTFDLTATKDLDDDEDE